MSWSALRWKRFYADELHSIGERGLSVLLDKAQNLSLDPGSAIIFPHTRLRDSGDMTAAAAAAVIRSGCEEVLAIGVMHGARERDGELVRRARDGDFDAITALRCVHGPGAAGDAGFWQEEFSLDSFQALLQLAARRASKAVPRVVARYPFLVGDDPYSLRGMDELAAYNGRGCPLVATTDPVHHGAGYQTPERQLLPREDAQSIAFARDAVDGQLALLSVRDFTKFQQLAAQVRSDFQDAGPVLGLLLAPQDKRTLHDLRLVDYSDVLQADEPTWVAAALVTLVAANVID